MADETVLDDDTTDETETDAATETAVANKTAIDDAEGDASKAVWPTDWQDRLSKGDEKRGNVLKRYASPEAVADALLAAQARIRSGELKSALPDNPKPEELAAWRKDNGIPEKPGDYDLKFDDGLVVGEQDKVIVDNFLKRAHESNMKPDQVKATVSWYYAEQERIAEEKAQQDEQQTQEALDALNAEWGDSYRANMNMVKGLLSMFPEDVRSELVAARLPSGMGVFNNPDIIRAFAAIALEANPAGIVTPAGGGNIQQSIKDEIAEIESWMNAPAKSPEGKKYWGDDKVQERYRVLVNQRDKNAA